ncbi:hypothetical protein ACHHYP_13095 [Achlya hypogyna]|uniref:CRAL-TRIO domain-containing protein n=1 Tax=Achlya hypogyna TaxID=1202772 RepID=A0A1V9YG34_ACHHY|nr:hypothetical protein ACHHYP_13095 [Achlya hypogyna]
MAGDGDLDALLQERSSDLAALKVLVADVLGPEHDDVWLLRYLLSNSTPAASEAPIRFTIQWRRERSATILALRAGAKPTTHVEMEKFLVSGEHKQTTAGEPVIVVRIGLCNSKALMDKFSHTDVVEYMLLARETTMASLDAATRATRRLVKAITILDFAGFSLLRGHDARFTKVQAACSKLSEQMYPQLLGRTIFMHTPPIIPYLFRLLKPLLSQRTVQKVAMCPGGRTVRDCPYVAQCFPAASLPTFLGGTCTCDGGGCVGGIPNAQTTPVVATDDAGFTSTTIAPRSQQTMVVDVLQGNAIAYTVLAPGKRVEVAINFAGANGTTTPIVSNRFLQREDGPLDGSWLAPADGVVTLTLDGSDAVFRSRPVKYKVAILADITLPP